jgi:hypothetical protein
MAKRVFLLILLLARLCFAQTGVVKSEGQPIPGATVKATQGDRILLTLTDENGAFRFDGMGPGAWNVEASMFGFEVARREVQVASAPTRIDFTLQLRDRGGAQRAQPSGEPAGENNEAQSAALGTSPELAPPPQASAEGSNESFLVNGSLSRGLQTQPSDIAPDDLPLRAEAPRAGPGGPPGGPGFRGGGGGFPPGGPGGGFPGGGFPGGGFGGRGGGPGFRGRGPGGPNRPNANGAFIGNRSRRGQDQVHGQFFYTFRNSALDAKPFSLNGQDAPKAAYSQNRFGVNLGGPLIIPKIVNSEKTFFFFNYTGNLLRNPFDATTTVPTLAERGGDFSAVSTVLNDPSTHLPLAGNRITSIDPIAVGLLNYIPVPNQPNAVQNYRFITAVPANSQNLNTRVNQTLSKNDRIALGFNLQNRNGTTAQTFGFRDESSGRGVSVNLNWTHNVTARVFNNVIGSFNRNSSNLVPFFANGVDVAAQLGIQGTSPDPQNYGPPNLSFTNFGALSDGSPLRNATYSFGVAENLALHIGKHNWSLGGDYRRYLNNTITDSNGRGTFTFTGLGTSGLDANGQPLPGTGLDFADFLFGLPHSDSIRYGSSSTYFRTNSYSAFAQDDWRLLPNLSFNLGIRYEYFAPWQEKYGHIANLDIAPGFTAVAPVTPGQIGLYSGIFPSGLINPDRNNFSPRTALAWKPKAAGKVTIRAGYGWYYNPSVYNQFTSRLSAQPPFANSKSVNTSEAQILTLATGLTATAGKEILNTYAVNRFYRDAYAQSWNFSVQTDLPHALVLEVSYLGTKGTRLDIQRAPNRAPPGSPLTAEQRLRIGNATGFTYDSPDGNSIYHAGQLRLTRRFRSGLSMNLQYTYAKSIDDSSTLGGAGNTVAQNDQNLSAERGLSSFDRRHVFTANYVWTSPVGGRTGLLASHPWAEKALKDWTVSGNATIETGTPLTARVLGNLSDTGGTGAIGSGRAQATGLPVTGSGYFDLAAFTVPSASAFGNAGRNTIPGPGLFSMNLSLGRSISIGERRRLEFRVDSNNFLNHVNISNLSTVVNSITYGLPTAAAGMRSLTATMRFRF